MKPTLVALLSLVAVLVSLRCLQAAPHRATPARAAAPAGKSAALSFHKDVMPIFTASCVGCHNDKNPSNGLTLTSFSALLKGGKGGKEIAPGKSGDSRLVKY